MRFRTTASGVALGLLVSSALAVPAVLNAQGPEGRWPLQPESGVGRIVAPFFEGWYHNEDGTYSFSFGYSNYNDSTVELVGDANQLTPSQFSGQQPTVFLPGKHRGMFAVTVPEDFAQDVWWTLTNPSGEVTKVPGRHDWNAYQLDWNPRPHGTVPPQVWFDAGKIGRGPPGVYASNTVTAKVGTPVTLQVNIKEISQRDPTDPRFREPTSLRVIWSKYQGPVGAEVEFTRHPSTPVPEEPEEDSGQRRREGPPPGPETIMVPSGEGLVRVMATFPEPGEYLINAQVDNWRAPDSASGDQCCWTNGYQRVTVTP